MKLFKNQVWTKTIPNPQILHERYNMNQKTEEAGKVKSRNRKLKNIIKTKKYKQWKAWNRKNRTKAEIQTEQETRNEQMTKTKGKNRT